jgi:hypothetical protein
MAARVDGDCDERGLPDPLALAFYVGPQSGMIFQLIILCETSALVAHFGQINFALNFP